MPASTTVLLPDGYTLNVTPVFGGYSFKSSKIGDGNLLPPGWSIVINTLRDPKASKAEEASKSDFDETPQNEDENPFDWESSRYTHPTLNSDYIFISSIHLPSSKAIIPKSIATCQIALILWSTLYWYFHQAAPNNRVTNDKSVTVPERARPKGEWQVHIRHEGVLKGRNLLLKFERMGLVTTENSVVGLEDPNGPPEDLDMFVSRRSFWQIDPHIFLFSLTPDMTLKSESPCCSGTTSPSRAESYNGGDRNNRRTASPSPLGSFYSSGHVPSYFPPSPAQWVMLDGWLRHPIRQKPPRQGETFYIRHIPSLQKTLSFRVPILSANSPDTEENAIGRHRRALYISRNNMSEGIKSLVLKPGRSDLELLHTILNSQKAKETWDSGGPIDIQEEFIKARLTSKNLFPAIGCWNGKPFGYFEIFWVKEGSVKRPLPVMVDDFDRGLRCVVLDEEDKRPHQTQVWLNALIHYCFLADNRTQAITIGPRIDDEEYLSSLIEAGFYKEGEFALPNKQCAIMRLKRDNWEAPTL
ncbi:aerobactin siderophore biosynthesis protein iucB [Nannizzia gypsea CBS 118893]|uniref:Aerobactin siderophore biosynthesis protein iucB n=1 Tax=Arthroderma gypseum (strain ATCC MYA-4604 / CBS 118893) TaxID=535722 RepID=E4UQ46_ARTGP|nr:aerobactin siderophore biosynthesis protein iucB [Nannizzia gypsea CBS 118893]EFQ99965.1 aerobactin siderophore biosynthesis protein iucB [Nannizzia gypsea CBS 118893]